VLVESRISNSRAVAVGLIADLSNRMLLNRDAAIGTPVNPKNTTAIASAYTLSPWTAAPAAPTVAAPDPTDCRANTVICTPAQLAQSDLMSWRRAVAAVFPGGQATVFNSPNDARQIGIAIAWPANERNLASTSDQVLAAQPFSVTPTTGVTCPATFICHVVYVQP
jgi:hypothetical protein